MPRRKYSYIHQDLQKLARPIEELTPDPKNARTHGDRNMSAIRGSLKEFGFRGAIIAQKSGDELIVRAGNGRLEAARQLGWSHVPVLVYSDDDKTSAAFALADNRTAELAAWDFEQIAGLIKEGALDEEIDIGFSSEEIQRILDGEILPLGESDSILDGEDAGEHEGLTDPDEVPEEPEEPRTKTGDLWILGDHRLLCGDSTKADEVARLMDGEKADMMQTDPPYGVAYSGQSDSMVYGGSKGKSREKIKGDDSPKEAGEIMRSAFNLNKCKIAFVWAAPQYHDLAKSALYGCGYKLFSLIVWNKNHANFGAMGATYKPKYEMALACNIKGIPYFGPNNETTVWDCDRNSSNKLHPTQKPIELFARAIRNHTQAGGVVYDPFLGSGTSIIAAAHLGRKCYGMELDRGYCDVIVKRWEDFTGKKAHLSKK